MKSDSNHAAFEDLEDLLSEIDLILCTTAPTSAQSPTPTPPHPPSAPGSNSHTTLIMVAIAAGGGIEGPQRHCQAEAVAGVTP